MSAPKIIWVARQWVESEGTKIIRPTRDADLFGSLAGRVVGGRYGGVEFG